MRSFLLGAEREGAFNIPFKVERGGGVPTARDYVQDGLIAMWDGIENAGFDSHDGTSSVWRDLVGGNNMSVVGADGWTTNAYVLNGTNSRYASGTLGIDLSADFSFEFCAVIHGVNESGRFYGYNLSNGNANFCDCGLRNYDSTRLFSYVGLGLPATGASLAAINPPLGVLLSSSTTRSGGNSEFFSNGASVFSASQSAISTNRNSVFTIGGGHNGKYGAVADVHCMRVYNRALTPAEIAANYAVDKARFNLQ